MLWQGTITVPATVEANDILRVMVKESEILPIDSFPDVLQGTGIFVGPENPPFLYDRLVYAEAVRLVWPTIVP